MGRDAGFTLLEAMVAFIIAALALGALTQGAAGGLLSARVSGHTQEALSRAKSRMAVLGDRLASGEQRGDDGGGYAWRVTVTPVATARPEQDNDPARSGRAVLYAVTVTVSWRMDGGERQVVFGDARAVVAHLHPRGAPLVEDDRKPRRARIERVF